MLLPFRAKAHTWCTSGPKGPLVHVNKYYNAHTRLLLMAISGENIGKNALKMASKSGLQNVHKIIRSIISHEAISGEKDGKMALISAPKKCLHFVHKIKRSLISRGPNYRCFPHKSALKSTPKMASKNVHKLNEV